MVQLISDTWGIVQLILTILIMLVLFGTILFLDYVKKGDNKKITYILMTTLFSLLGILLVLTMVDLVLMGSPLEFVLQAIVLVYTAVVITMVMMAASGKEYNRKLFISILGGLFLTLVIIAIVLWNQGTTYESLHLGSIIGFPALILVSLGTILVILDENKYVLYHGYTAGSAWLLTLFNVILLFALTQEIMKEYSGWLHALHIVCGGIGLTFGFASGLFGISGQRKLAKVTGYTTLACWWIAYLTSIFIERLNV